MGRPAGAAWDWPSAPAGGRPDAHAGGLANEHGKVSGVSAARGRPAEAIRYLTQALRLSARAGQEPGGLAAFPSSVNRRAIDGGEPPTGAGRL